MELSKAIKNTGLSINQLARRMNMGTATLWRYVNVKDVVVNYDNYQKLKNYFDGDITIGGAIPLISFSRLQKRNRIKPKKETPFEMVIRILSEEEKTVLPRKYKYKEKELIQELKKIGIETECYYSSVGEGYFLRRLN